MTAAVVLPLLLLAAAPTATAPAAAAPPALAPEWFSIELTPVSTHAGNLPDPPILGTRQPERYSLGAGGALNLLRRTHRRLYWTPLHLPLRVTVHGAETFQAAIQTELGGLLWRWDPGWLELGAALGYGGLEIASPDNNCDGPCSIGGVGPMLSPVVRVRHSLPLVYPRLEAGVLLRAVIPLRQGTDLFGQILARAVLFTAGLEVVVGSP